MLLSPKIKSYFLTVPKEVLEDMYIVGNFPYQHIVIDEGQDFGKSGMEEAGLIELLKMNVLNDESKNGTF